MLKDLDRAILGGHFMNDSEINKYPKLVAELLEFYTPEIFRRGIHKTIIIRTTISKALKGGT